MVFVVRAGRLDDLRSQTQIRLEEGLLGYDKLNQKIVGVGTHDMSLKLDSVTTRANNGDFSRAAAKGFSIHPGATPLLFVVKKNASVLRNLLNWVKFAAKNEPKGKIRNVPLLVIDDEADHASVDTKEQERDENGNLDPDHDPATINKLIRRLLVSFEQKAYVGYTATPFANIFIHDQGRTKEEGPDLFPRSFIVSLPAPSDYVGPRTLFSETGPDLVKRTDEDKKDSFKLWMPPKHKKEHKPPVDLFPDSLREALRAFLLSCAARRVRGQAKDHSTMLVHVTRFTDVQKEVALQIDAELIALRNAVLFGGPNHPEAKKLEALWNNEFVPITAAMSKKDARLTAVSWQQLVPVLAEAAAPIVVRQINGTAGDVLDYHTPRIEGLKVIAVGGDKLSRGLTLQGLSVSYFLRTTKMYDTLMQMGRWFGYRPGYLDLCRIWMPEDLNEWFEHITEANEELRQAFDEMVARGGTPDRYGLKVRSHKVMTVTSALKMRHATTLQISYAGTTAETTTFHLDARIRKENKAALDHFVSGLGEAVENPVQPRGEKQHRWAGARLWSEVEATTVAAFLRNVKTHEAATSVDSGRLAEFIERQTKVSELVDWTVVLLGNGKGMESNVGGLPINCITRDEKKNSRVTGKGPEKDKVSVRRILSPRDEAIDLDGPAWAQAVIKTKQIRTIDAAREGDAEESEPEDDVPRNDLPSGPGIRAVRPKEKGLLLLYPLDPAVLGFDDKVPVVGFGLSFPASDSTVAVSYEVNNVFASEYGAT
jgi:hypothetical protein